MSIHQNAKTLLEAIYEFERLKKEKASKKELDKIRGYAEKLINNIRGEIEHGQR